MNENQEVTEISEVDQFGDPTAAGRVPYIGSLSFHINMPSQQVPTLTPIITKKIRESWNLKIVLEDHHVLPISQALKDWERVGIELGLDRTRIANWKKQVSIERVNQSIGAERMLLGWLQKEDLKAKICKLCHVLFNCQEYDAILQLP